MSIQQTTTLNTLLEEYNLTRLLSESITSSLSDEAFVIQPTIDVSPPKWHLGHTTWFFENFLLAPREGYTLFNPRYNYCFNSYYESQGERINRSQRGNLIYPRRAEVIAYRKHVDAHMNALLQEELAPEVLELITVGIHHEQQHQELLITDIKYILGNNPFFPTYNPVWPAMNQQPKHQNSTSELFVQSGIYEIGYRGKGFCFDNELSVHKVYLEDVLLDSHTVTNGEYLEFVDAGGYQQYQYWLSEGWDWVNQEKIKAPLYWIQDQKEWYEYTLCDGLQKLDLAKPVTHISYFEAEAYAQFRQKRLATEQEWEAAASVHGNIDNGIFLDSQFFHPHESGAANLMGNVWQWTQSAYLPYPRYPRFKGALGEYNGKFMANQMVLRGGSCATPHSHIRSSYRNFFHTDKRWQFTGIRLAKTV